MSYCSRRLPIYFLCAPTSRTCVELARFLYEARSDPQMLESLWLSVIDAHGGDQLALPLAPLEDVQEIEPRADALDLDFGAGIEAYLQARKKDLVPRSGSKAGDWRPTLVLILHNEELSNLTEGLQRLESERCGLRIAFVIDSVTTEIRASLKASGFQVLELLDEPMHASWVDVRGSPNSTWPHVLLRMLTRSYFNWHAALVPPAKDTNLSTQPMRSVPATLSPESKAKGLFMNSFGNLSARGRLSRRGLLMYLLPYCWLTLIAVSVGFLSITLSSIVALMAFCGLVIGFVRRAHDIGYSGWFILIPFFCFWLFFAPGQDSVNRFGPKPLSANPTNRV